MPPTPWTWFAPWKSVAQASRKPRRQRSTGQYRFRPQVESLEDRITPTQVFLTVAPNPSGSRGETVMVSVNVDTLQNDLFGSSGLCAFDIVIRYDQTIFSESNADIGLGSLIPAD